MTPADFAALRAQLDALEGADLRQIPKQELNRRLVALLQGVTRQRIYLGDRQIWHRARLCANGERFNQVSQLSYVKEPDDYGRAHVPKQAMFYAARNGETAISEIGVRDGEIAQVLAARVKPGLICKSDIIGEFEYVWASGLSLLGYEKSIELVSRLDKELGPAFKRDVLIDAFLARQFRKLAKREHEYLLTSFTAMNLFDSGAEALMYPSVEQVGGLNIAIPAKVFDEKFELLWTDVFRTHYLGYGQYFLEALASSEKISADGTIAWAPSPIDRSSLWTLKKGFRIPEIASATPKPTEK